MFTKHVISYVVIGTLFGLMAGGGAFGQTAPSHRRWASNVLLPQSREEAFSLRGPTGAIKVTAVEASVKIVDQVAATTLTVRLHNTSRTRQEAELVMPVPAGAVVRSFTYEGAGEEGQAQVLTKEEARRIYDSLVAKIKDPALLEFVGYNLVRSSVFPVEARAKTWLRLTYEQVLHAQGERVDYVLPRSEMLGYALGWELAVDIEARQGLATVYSASHQVKIERINDRRVRVTVPKQAQQEPGPFRLSYLLERDGLTGSVLAYPDSEADGGYFLLLVGMGNDEAEAGRRQGLKREVTLVLDRSGSMRGQKIDQVREAALQLIAGLEKGERFNIITYNTTVDVFSPEPVVKNATNEKAAQRHLEALQAQGSTNIYDALLEALRQKPTEGTLPMLLFLTDGLPTVGNTNEVAIRQMVAKQNKHARRLFTFGVGFDVNAPLLERLADKSRGSATFVLPKEDVEAKVGQLFDQLAGPVLAEPALEVNKADGNAATGRTMDVLPALIPDLFANDQLVVLGRYVGEEPLRFVLRGDYLGQEQQFTFAFDPADATTQHAFVGRLWASRQIAVLIEAVRQLGAKPGVSSSDPKVKELTEEIVRLSREFGILTEYTAFLAREGTDLAAIPALEEQVGKNLQKRAMRTRSGRGAVNQSFNLQSQKAQTSLNRRNEFMDAQMRQVAVDTVQQINDLAFYRRCGRWVDGRLASDDKAAARARVVTFGSPAYGQLVATLVKQGRQGALALGEEVLVEVDGEAILARIR